MLAELALDLDVEGEALTYYQSSNLQGVLMSIIQPDYVSYLHQQGLNPYSQCLIQKNRPIWYIRTTTKEAYENIIEPLLSDNFREFEIEKKKAHITVVKKELRKIEKKSLLDQFYSRYHNKYLNLIFETPASFKSRGRYWNFPEPKLIFQSLMNKYSASSENVDMYDQETLEQILRGCSIGRYQIHSTIFPVEGVRIPSFIGEMGIRIDESPTLARYVRLLAQFGEFSGVGIKTGIGMGAIRIVNGKGRYGSRN